jgi:membrane fusion protein
MTSPVSPGPDTPSPFLDTDPPHWAARGLSTLLIALFVTASIVAVTVRVPETVTGSFVLVPERGADPLRAPREGTVSEVRVVEGQTVPMGATIFTIRSEPVGDRRAEIRSLEVLSSGVEGRIANARAEYESQRRADEIEAKRLETRIPSLDRVASLKKKQLDMTQEMSEQSKKGQQQGAIGGWEAGRLALDAERLAAEAEEASSDLENTRATLSRLRQDMDTRAVRYRELVRSLTQEGEMARVRLASMRANPAGESSGDLVITAPCNGTVLRMNVNTPGAVVQPGDALGEFACSGEKLQVEMTLGQLEVARVRAGQSAKLLYDAFPYQRFGVKFGRVRWVGPASTARTIENPGNDNGAFKALIDATDSMVVVAGEPRPLLVGMRGRARVVTGRRSLISFAFEPIRALRENMADAPPAIEPPPPPAKRTTATPADSARSAS